MYRFNKDVNSNMPKFTMNTAAGSIGWNGANWYFQDISGAQTAIIAPDSITIQLGRISMPGQPDTGPAYGNSTGAQAMNDAGDIVGLYTDANGLVHGFYRDPDGNFRTIDVPGATGGTWVAAITNEGHIAGTYRDADGEHTYEAIPVGFNVSDQSKGTHWSDPGMQYQGPVTGLSDEYVTLTHDNLNVSAAEPSVFIHTGAGADAIQASAGANILDGSTGSNFLSGGVDHDTFYVDDRNPSADVWSTIANFHPGDTAVIWGITAKDSLLWQGSQGAAHYEGLTLHVSGAQTASMTFAGFAPSDLDKLSIGYGRTADQAGLPGSSYMMITEN